MKRRLGKYTLGEKLGGGSMGTVYAAYDESLQRQVAIKTMVEKIGQDPELKLRFYREARSAAGLHHPNIVAIYDMGEDGDTAYIVMELLDGMDLKRVIHERASLSLEQKISIVAQIGDGMEHAHDRGVLHRDIKPGNIHVNRIGIAKILDFGIAYIPSSNLTESGVRLGTPVYMSPEQIRGERCDARSDIFSTGTLTYELVTYTHPFRDRTLQKTIDRTLFEEKPPLEQHFPEAPPGLWAVIGPALAKYPGRRYQKMSELSSACRSLLRELHTASHRIAGELQSAIPLLERSCRQATAPAELTQMLADIRGIQEQIRNDQSDVLEFRRVQHRVERWLAAHSVRMPENEKPASIVPQDWASRPDDAESAHLVDLGQKALRRQDLAEAGRFAQLALQQGCESMAARDLVAQLDARSREKTDEPMARKVSAADNPGPVDSGAAPTELLPNAQRRNIPPPDMAERAVPGSLEKTQLLWQAQVRRKPFTGVALLAAVIVLAATALLWWRRPTAPGRQVDPELAAAQSELEHGRLDQAAARARILLAAGKPQAGAILREAETQNTRRKLEVMLVEAQNLRTQQKYAESMAKVRDILEIDPENRAAQAIQAQIADSSGGKGRPGHSLPGATKQVPAEIPRAAPPGGASGSSAALLQLEYLGARYPVKIQEGSTELGPLPAALSAGEHEIHLVGDGVFLNRKEKISVSPGKDQFILLPGIGSASFEVVADAYDGCEILLDGKSLPGPYPAQVPQLVAGDHNVMFRWTSGPFVGKRVVSSFSVGENAHTQVRGDPEKNSFLIQQVR